MGHGRREGGLKSAQNDCRSQARDRAGELPPGGQRSAERLLVPVPDVAHERRPEGRGVAARDAGYRRAAAPRAPRVLGVPRVRRPPPNSLQSCAHSGHRASLARTGWTAAPESSRDSGDWFHSTRLSTAGLFHWNARLHLAVRSQDHAHKLESSSIPACVCDTVPPHYHPPG